jgi:hypothetical protein
MLQSYNHRPLPRPLENLVPHLPKLPDKRGAGSVPLMPPLAGTLAHKVALVLQRNGLGRGLLHFRVKKGMRSGELPRKQHARSAAGAQPKMGTPAKMAKEPHDNGRKELRDSSVKPRHQMRRTSKSTSRR